MLRTSGKIIISIIIIFLIIGFAYFYFRRPAKPSLKLNRHKNMELTSPAFKNNKFIPAKYTCDGDDVNPPLKINKVPAGVKSLALVIDDPDAPIGTWDHWIIWNIGPDVSEIIENSVPKGASEGVNSFNKHSYGGPCPPSGIHHYHFKLYALDIALSLPEQADKKDLESAMASHILDQTELIGLYRP